MTEERASIVAELEALRRQADVLAVKLAAARRSWWMPAFCLLLGLALGSAVVPLWQTASLAQEASGPLPKQPGQPGQQIRDLVCSAVKIVGPDGKARVTLAYDQKGGHLKIHAPDGKVRSTLSVGNDNTVGILELLDENGKLRTHLSGGKEGGGFCKFFSKTGKEHAYIGSDINNSGGLVYLHGAQGSRVVNLGHDTEGGAVSVAGQDGKVRANLWVRQGGKTGLLSLRNELGKILTDVGIDDHGGFVDLYGNNDKRQVILDCHQQWGGRLWLYTPQGGNLIFLGGNANNSHGLFKLYGTDGQSRLEMFVDNGGIGAVNAFNATGQVVRSLK